MHYIDRVIRSLGRTFSWLTLGMVVVMFASVVQRYLFQSNYIWEYELVMFMHAIVFLGAAAYTLQDDEHVRLDVLYERFSPRLKQWVNLLGTLLFLIPVSIALLYYSWGFVISSWEIQEGSREPGGLPGVFLLKTFLWVFAITLFLQGASMIWKNIHARNSG